MMRLSSRKSKSSSTISMRACSAFIIRSQYSLSPSAARATGAAPATGGEARRVAVWTSASDAVVLEVVGVQEVVRDLAARRPEVLLVERADGGVLVRLAQLAALVLAVDG